MLLRLPLKVTTTTTSTSMTSHKITMAVMHHLETKVHVICSFFVQFSSLTAGTVSLFFFTVDLNIPLDEFGAVDFSYIGNDAGKVFSDDVYL